MKNLLQFVLKQSFPESFLFSCSFVYCLLTSSKCNRIHTSKLIDEKRSLYQIFSAQFTHLATLLSLILSRSNATYTSSLFRLLFLSWMYALFKILRPYFLKFYFIRMKTPCSNSRKKILTAPNCSENLIYHAFAACPVFTSYTYLSDSPSPFGRLSA